MFSKYFWVTVIGCSLVVTSWAQSSEKAPTVRKSCSCGFSSINQLGIATGENNNSVLLQTINGFRYKTWFAGVGVGYDTYYAKTVPLFLDLRKSLFLKPSTPFLYLDGGVQFMGEKKTDKGSYYTKQYHPGAYYDMGIGYQIGLRNKSAILMSAGYSQKYLKYHQYTEVVCIMAPCPSYSSHYNFRLNRLAFKIGYQF
ncbi:hypothetical protein [Paraflavitalea speifideaquila]|uniref:hypothetical protein n=1 Tax=Paraflavitalea speifideaquila TaxID=3076558 RepID=UPI0028E6DB2B|nr:hypothetical protein [Paraflavitalea speifideiaquila]